MDYSTWSHFEAVPLANGVISRRSGFQYMKPPQEILSYYQQHFGAYWFNELPKTGNTYSPSNKYYGCTLAPGIPLIPNLCRRPLRSPSNGGGEYDYTYALFTKTHADEVANNHHNDLIEINNFLNNKHELNGTTKNHLGHSKLSKRRVEFQDSGLDSDSDFDDSQFNQSQNSVTWLNWIIITVTTVITTITETVTGRQNQQNHFNTRVPVKESGGVSWYQYPVLWLYKLALLVHQADLWLLSKVHSVIKLDSWGTSQQRRKWALILLMIPLLLWAGLKLAEWLSDGEPLLLPMYNMFSWLAVGLSSAWGWLCEGVSGGLWTVIGWFDGTLLWTPWATLTDWWGDSSDQLEDEETTSRLSDYDWGAVFSYPFTCVGAFLASIGSYLSSAVSSLGERTVWLVSTAGSFLADVLAWLFDCITSVPALLSSALAWTAYPFKSMKWESAPVDYTPSAPPAPPGYYSPHSPPAPAPDPPGLDLLLRDKHLLSLLVRNMLSSEEFDRAMVERHSTSQAQLNLAVDSAFSAASNKIDMELKRVKEELDEKIISEDSSFETKVNLLKNQIEELQMALIAHKTLVSEQVSLGNRLETRVTSAEMQLQAKGSEDVNLKEQILLEVEKIKEEITLQLMASFDKKMVAESGNFPPDYNPTEIEALINSTVERLLAIYDADKIAKVDYALANSGGSVLNVRCTETFSKKNAQYYMWGYPLWNKPANDPTVALEPGMSPGECWAFTGSRGYLVIELSENITVTAFTLEHLPRSLSPSGTIDTAPKEFRVLGLESEQDDTPILLGRFKYEDNGTSLQHFQAMEVDHSFKIVELVIESNHGNLEYTCLYRFRVHGKPVRHT